MSSDVVIVGAGIVGLASAWAAHRMGHRVRVLEKDHHCVGASIRNFGFITVTGQGSGVTWQRARETRDIWSDIAPQAGIQQTQRGLWVLAQRPEAVDVLKDLLHRPEGQDLRWYDRADLKHRYPVLVQGQALGALYSPYELRYEPREAIGQLRTWLESLGVVFQTNTLAQIGSEQRLFVHGEEMPYQHLVVAPGPDVRLWAPKSLAMQKLSMCRLNMLRVRPPRGYVLPAPVMSDLSLVRYRGYAELPSSLPLHRRLQIEQPEHLNHGIHLIVVQSADGSLIVGDSHHYQDSIGPFALDRTDQLILQEMQAVLNLEHFEVTERWVGYYPSGPQDAVIYPIGERASLISVTSGTGMSTSFALAQEWAEGHL